MLTTLSLELAVAFERRRAAPMLLWNRAIATCVVHCPSPTTLGLTYSFSDVTEERECSFEPIGGRFIIAATGQVCQPCRDQASCNAEQHSSLLEMRFI